MFQKNELTSNQFLFKHFINENNEMNTCEEVKDQSVNRNWKNVSEKDLEELGQYMNAKLLQLENTNQDVAFQIPK